MGTWSTDKENTTEPVCPICKGAGFIHPKSNDGKVDFGSVVPCECTLKVKSEEKLESLMKYSQLGSLAKLSFDNLVSEGRSGNSQDRRMFLRAYEAAKAFADEPKGWLILIGPSGSGKTHLAVAIANERISNGYTVLYQMTADLLDNLRATYSTEKEVLYEQLFEQVRNAPLLILEDFGHHSATDWAKEKLDQLLNYRFNNELSTILTTSTSLKQLPERMQSRFENAGLCKVLEIRQSQASGSEYSWPKGLELQKKMTFENYDWKRVNLPKEQQASLEHAYKFALNFAQQPEGWLIVMGVTGAGKTHLASAIANYRYQQGKAALFIVVPEFLDHLRSTFSPESKKSYDQLFEKVKTTPLLILDDFGEQASTQWAQEKLYQVINYRYNAELPTVVTTRLSLEEIESRISSRFVDPKLSSPISLNVPDFRGSISEHKPKTLRRSRGRN